jgi:outer membrane protein assembly factor BamA
MRAPSSLVLVLCLAALSLVPALASAQETRAEVEDVEMEGVEALDERRVRLILETRESTCRSPLLFLLCAVGAGERRAYLDSAAVRRDEARIDSLYDAWGYPDAAASAEIAPLGGGGVRVRFRVSEGAPLVVRSVAVRGLEALPEPVDVGVLPLREGDPYAIPRLEAAQQQVAAALAEEGYAFAQVAVSGGVDAAARAADVVLEVTPGRVAVFGETAAVRAQAPLDEDVVRERLAYRAGERFSPAALRRTAERLHDLPVVQEVRIEPVAAAPGDTAVRTVVSVARGKLGAWQAVGTVSTSSCLGGTMWWEHRHLLGAPRVFSLTGGGSNLGAGTLCPNQEGDEFEELGWFARAELREPVAPETWLVLNAEYSRETAPGAYVRRGVRGRAALAGRLGAGLTGLFGYAPERTENEAGGPFFCALYGACAGAELASLTGERTLAPLEASLGWSPPGARRTRLGPVPAESAWAATAGPRWIYQARATVSGGAGFTGSEVEFGRALVEGSVARLLGARTEAAFRARAGALSGGDERLPPQLRLFGGGPLGVRGVPANRLGPRVLLLRDDAAGSFGCDPGADPCPPFRVDPDDVIVRALGGEALVEAGVEARWWASRKLQLAAFVDAGAVWTGADDGVPAGLTTSESVVTPGIGALVVSPVGPVRLDVAYNPSPARIYPLLERDENTGEYTVVGRARWDPYSHDGAGGWKEFRRRLQLQVSLGQTF